MDPEWYLIVLTVCAILRVLIAAWLLKLKRAAEKKTSVIEKK